MNNDLNIPNDNNHDETIVYNQNKNSLMNNNNIQNKFNINTLFEKSELDNSYKLSLDKDSISDTSDNYDNTEIIQ